MPGLAGGPDVYSTERIGRGDRDGSTGSGGDRLGPVDIAWDQLQDAARCTAVRGGVLGDPAPRRHRLVVDDAGRLDAA